MNLTTETLWTLLRALAIAVAALVIGACLARTLGGLRGSRRATAWALLLAPALTPSIIVGYALLRSAPADLGEALYAAVLLAKLVPIAVVVLWLIPSPFTAEARHCLRLSSARSLGRRLSFRFHAAGRGPVVALALVFLLAFTEFELAALGGVRSWTVALFDAHAGGLPWIQSLRLGALPAAIEATILASCWLAFRGAAPALTVRRESAEMPLSLAVLAYLVLTASVITFFPLLRIVRQAAPSGAIILETFTLGTDLAASATFALGASSAAWLFARRLSPARAALLSLPGLLGALVLSLLLLAFFQLPGLRLAYDTIIPLLLALTLLLLPLAILLRWVLDVTRQDSAMFIATQLGHRELRWQLEGRQHFAAWALLFCWAFFEFTAASMLAPVGFSPVFVRLHNLMHYGQTAVLSAMVCVAFATPVAVLLLTGAAARFYARQHGR